ncbi:hypothetical protein HPB47_001873 [Ixodes persulcatus]|uniref:Uncharacterized protein n=1 Tax=Ixodes persulcatus TaxID=34615 RepID=A0AC60PPA7_IXOPE|nr:hypothetical protein HPB47_001873 [Ixodes persulcatus]
MPETPLRRRQKEDFEQHLHVSRSRSEAATEELVVGLGRLRKAPIQSSASLPASPVHRGPFWRGAMGSSCSSAQKKDKKQRWGPHAGGRGRALTALARRGSPGLESLASPLLGRLGEGEEEEQGSRQLGLYVCSALPDTLAERTLLMERVYPALRHQAAQRGYDLCLADLHWGMRLNDRALLAEVCLSTLARLRARGRLLALVLLPERLEGGLPQTLPPWLPGGLAGGLAEWYVPDGRGGQRLRAPVGDAAPLEAALREVLSPLQRALYLTSVLEEEVRAAVLCPAQRPQDCVWLERRWTHRPRPDGAPPADDDGARRFGALRGELEDRLPEAHKLVVRARWGEAEEASYLAEVGCLLERALGALLDGAAEADAAQEAGRPCGNLERALALELCQQGAWARDLARGFVGRTESLSRLERYVQSGGGRPLVVHGPPGVGKSALVARAAALCADWLPGAPVVARFVGAVPASPDRLLCSLCEHVCALSGVHPAEASRSGADRRALLGSLLGRSERPLVLVLDGLDQLEGDWDWLPARLPPHVRLLLTLRDGCPQLEELEPECLLALGPLPVPEAEAIVRAALERSGRILNPEQWTLVAACLEREGSPLQAHLLAALAERWGPDDQPPGDTTLGGLAAEAVRLAEREVGPRLVPFVLGLLSVARHGLSDAEVLDALSRHPATFEACPSLDGSPARCPPGLWALVRTVLRPFLRTRVVAGRALHTWRGEAHRALLCEGRLDADTMRDCALALVALFSEGRDARSLVELPWIALGLARRGDGAALGAALGAPGQPPLALVRERFLLDAGWLRDKATAAEPWLLLEELRTYLSLEPSDAECCLLAETLELAAYALRYDGRQLAAQLWARLRRRLEQGDLPRLEALCAALRAAGPGLEPRSAHLREPGAQTWTGPCAPSDEGPCLGRLYTIRGDAAHMVSLDRADLRVWDVRAERVVRHLAGLPQPRDLQMVDPFRALVLCDRELRVYSLDEGRLLVRLKGVMNQKMAYFGLHGRDYAVALSRNRMFLNSLLVSANGKICVCGDETQKPFPLLVWDLSRRKLLYDLRIPHHEFLTRLSAISGDGHYVVCVCRASPF